MPRLAPVTRIVLSVIVMCCSLDLGFSTIWIALLRTEIRAHTQIHRSSPKDQNAGVGFRRPLGSQFKTVHADSERRAEMGKIVISENVTLDGVVQDPTGEEGFARGGWFGQIKDRPDVARLALDDALHAEALLL